MKAWINEPVHKLDSKLGLSQMTQMNAQAKYIAVNIPVPLMRRIEKLVTTQGGFMSASDYMTYVLRVVLSRRPEENDYEPFSSRDLEEIRARLIALG